MPSSKTSITIAFKPQGKAIKVPWSRSMTVEKALEEAYDHEPGVFFVTRYYGSKFGTKIVMIGDMWDGDYGFGSSSYADHYWLLYLNGQFVNMGVDKVEIAAGDHVEFSYEHFSERLLKERDPGNYAV